MKAMLKHNPTKQAREKVGKIRHATIIKRTPMGTAIKSIILNSPSVSFRKSFITI